MLHGSHEMLQIFQENTVNVKYRQNKNLKQIISSFFCPRTIKEKTTQLKNVKEDAIFVKVFLYYLLNLLVMLPNINIK